MDGWIDRWMGKNAFTVVCLSLSEGLNSSTQELGAVLPAWPGFHLQLGLAEHREAQLRPPPPQPFYQPTKLFDGVCFSCLADITYSRTARKTNINMKVWEIEMFLRFGFLRFSLLLKDSSACRAVEPQTLIAGVAHQHLNHSQPNISDLFISRAFICGHYISAYTALF